MSALQYITLVINESLTVKLSMSREMDVKTGF